MLLQVPNLSFLILHKIILLLIATKKGFSFKEVQCQLGLKRYELVWAIVDKLRKAIGNRDCCYALLGYDR